MSPPSERGASHRPGRPSVSTTCPAMPLARSGQMASRAILFPLVEKGRWTPRPPPAGHKRRLERQRPSAPAANRPRPGNGRQLPPLFGEKHLAPAPRLLLIWRSPGTGHHVIAPCRDCPPVSQSRRGASVVELHRPGGTMSPAFQRGVWLTFKRASTG